MTPVLHSRTLMDCTLFIPCLLPPKAGEQGDALWRTVDAPELKQLLARATMATDTTVDAEAWLCHTFGIARQQDFPLAPLLAEAENLDAAHGYWLNATPAHLETRRNALVLADPAILKITIEESMAFAAILADHLREENVTLHAPRPDRWFLHCGIAPALATTSLATVIGRDIRPHLPRGADSARWHRILTEMQMLLHAHPANDAREARGLPPVNSVWLWGGGTLPAQAAAPFASVWSDNDIVRALARYGTCRCEPLPARISPETWKEGSHFFSFDPLATHQRNGDAQAWGNAVTALNRDWFIPLLGALKSRRLRTLTLVCTDDRGLRRFVLHAGDLMKFWRKNKYLV